MPAAFVEVSAPSEAELLTQPKMLEVVLRDGLRVVVPVDFDESHLQRVLRAMETR